MQSFLFLQPYMLLSKSHHTGNPHFPLTSPQMVQLSSNIWNRVLKRWQKLTLKKTKLHTEMSPYHWQQWTEVYQKSQKGQEWQQVQQQKYFRCVLPSIMFPFISNTMFYVFCAIGLQSNYFLEQVLALKHEERIRTSEHILWNLIYKMGFQNNMLVCGNKWKSWLARWFKKVIWDPQKQTEAKQQNTSQQWKALRKHFVLIKIKISDDSVSLC